MGGRSPKRQKSTGNQGGKMLNLRSLRFQGFKAQTYVGGILSPLGGERKSKPMPFSKLGIGIIPHAGAGAEASPNILAPHGYSISSNVLTHATLEAPCAADFRPVHQ